MRERTSRLAICAGAVVVFALGIGLFYTVRTQPNGPNIWWFFIVTMSAYLVAQGVARVFDSYAQGLGSDLWLPAGFAVFALTIFGGAVLADHATNWAVHAFDKPGAVAYVAFVLFDFGLPTLLYLDFVGRWERRRGPQSPK
jgi:hypothetical protein